MQQALEALESAADNECAFRDYQRAADSLRAALAAEPCACKDRPATECPGEWEPGCDLGNNPKFVRVAKEPSLSQKLAAVTCDECGAKFTPQMAPLHECAAEPAQPVAYRLDYPPTVGVGWPRFFGADDHKRMLHHLEDGKATVTPLYAAPPAQQPLTDERVRDLWSWSATAEAERTATTQQHAFARAIERAHGIGQQT